MSSTRHHYPRLISGKVGWIHITSVCLSHGPSYYSAPVDKQNALGWGNKATQFHGSLGKSAASAPSTSSAAVGASPDDDGLPRISWRGDATFFCVSSLEALEPDSPKRRVIRVYAPSPDLTLHSTVEPTPGLEHTLAWNPSGSLIASTQRYGSASPGLGAGREGRHDVVFFEKNGLRRGGFEIVKGGGQPNTPYENDYHIKELAWSCDSNVLAVWVRSRGLGDDTGLSQPGILTLTVQQRV